MGSDIIYIDAPYNGAISIHTPRMGSDLAGDFLNGCQAISIHTPRMGSDSEYPCPAIWRHISIHTPRMGSDWTK